VPALARTFRTFTYDRRGHSRSERLATQGSIEEDVADLAAFITTNHLVPAHVVGNSFGGAIALKLAAAQPDLFATAIVHEPPLLGMIGSHPMMPAVRDRLAAVLATLKSGNLETGARQFVENVAVGPGMWEKLPPDVQQTFVFNAPTWLDEMNEPESMMSVDLVRLATFAQPLLLTRGDQSPPFFHAILDQIAAAAPRAQQYTFHGAGHVPHMTNADEYVRLVADFVQRRT
jgi:pimeloyl-ACP methyl ester carboxylesterase